MFIHFILFRFHWNADMDNIHRFRGSARFQFGRCMFIGICTMKVYVLCGVLMANLLKPVCTCSCTNTVTLSLTSQYIHINIHLSISICIIAFFRRLIDIRIKNDISVLTDIPHKYPKNAVYVPQKQPTYFFLSPHRTNTENENKISTKTYMHACTKKQSS